MDIKTAIDTRHTLKVLADPEDPWVGPKPGTRDKLAGLLQTAVQAPFHKPAHEGHRAEPLTSPVPWRFHAIDGQNCRRLLERLQAEDVESGKIKNMLAAADGLVLATWLPNPADEPLGFQEYAGTFANMEHIAAASAAIQNLLLLATAEGWNSYWSSGGILRSEMVFEWAGISLAEILLGAVFLFPADTRDVPAKPGALRDQKGPAETWSRWVDL